MSETTAPSSPSRTVPRAFVLLPPPPSPQPTTDHSPQSPSSAYAAYTPTVISKSRYTPPLPSSPTTPEPAPSLSLRVRRSSSTRLLKLRKMSSGSSSSQPMASGGGEGDRYAERYCEFWLLWSPQSTCGSTGERRKGQGEGRGNATAELGRADQSERRAAGVQSRCFRACFRLHERLRVLWQGREKGPGKVELARTDVVPVPRLPKHQLKVG